MPATQILFFAILLLLYQFSYLPAERSYLLHSYVKVITFPSVNHLLCIVLSEKFSELGSLVEKRGQDHYW